MPTPDLVSGTSDPQLRLPNSTPLGADMLTRIRQAIPDLAELNSIVDAAEYEATAAVLDEEFPELLALAASSEDVMRSLDLAELKIRHLQERRIPRRLLPGFRSEVVVVERCVKVLLAWGDMSALESCRITTLVGFEVGNGLVIYHAANASVQVDGLRKRSLRSLPAATLVAPLPKHSMLGSPNFTIEPLTQQNLSTVGLAPSVITQALTTALVNHVDHLEKRLTETKRQRASISSL